MRQCLIALSCIAGGIVLTACTIGSGTRTSAIIYQPTRSECVEIFFEKPERSYQIIGQVSSKGESMASDDAIYRALQKEAAELGAHAILVQSTGIRMFYVPGFEVLHNDVLARNQQRAQALAIRWTDGPPSNQVYALTPTSTKPTTPKEDQVIPLGVGRR